MSKATAAPAEVAADENPQPLPPISLAEVAAKVTDDTPVPFEPFFPDGSRSGITLYLRSDQSKHVQDGIFAIMNEGRRQEQIQAEKARRARPGEVFTPMEDDVGTSRKLAALRIAGWEGLTDPYSEANAIRLLKLIPNFTAQILRKADELASFTRTSAKSS